MITVQASASPPRAKLFCLAPIGIGTPFIESLESYTLRLARAHGISRKTLERYVNHHGDNLIYGDVAGPPRLDSPTHVAKEFASRLSTLTRRPEVRLLGLNRFAGRIAIANTAKRRRAWCPDCFSTAKARGEPAHLQSLWSLQTYEVCLVHRRALVFRCPHCNAQPCVIRSWSTDIDHCPTCKQSLVSSTESTQTGKPSLPSCPEHKIKIALSTVTADFIERAQVASELEPSSADVERLILSVHDRGIAVHARLFGNKAGVPAETLSCIRNLRNTPSLGVLARLAVVANASMAGLFFPDCWTENIFQDLRPDLTLAPRIHQKVKHDWADIRRDTIRLINLGHAEPLVSHAKRFGVCQAHFGNAIGELRDTIKVAAKEARDAKRAARYLVVAQDVKKAREELSSLGKKVTARAVSRHLRCSDRSPYFVRAYKEARHTAA